MVDRHTLRRRDGLYGWSDGTVWQPDTTGNVQARMPFGVAIGSDGTIYTTEDYYHIIRKVTGANIACHRRHHRPRRPRLPQ